MPNKPLERAIALTRLAPDTAATNTTEVVAALKREFKLSDFRARSLAAQAARRKRYTDLVKPRLTDAQILLSPRLAAEQSEYSAQHIRRACALGEIAGAAQDASRRWQFSLASFKRWIAEPRYHRRGNPNFQRHPRK